jgi:hypothetical protein
MATNISTLDSLQNKILLGELFEKTKNAGIVWTQITPTAYRALNIENSACDDPFIPDQTWEAILTRSITSGNESYTLDILRNSTLRVSLKSSENEELIDLYTIAERTVIDKTRAMRETIKYYQNLPTVHDVMFGPPFTLLPAADFHNGTQLGINSGLPTWNRVPANGYIYDKIRHPTTTASKNPRYIYTADASASIEFMFDKLPNHLPENYGTVKVNVSAKNIGGPSVLSLTLMIEGEGVDSDSKDFSLAISQEYAVYEFIWNGRSFTRDEVNNLRIQFVPSESINFINGVELLADDPE